uniref:Uncharacterized protein n=1 Tax=Leptobrachium leishanense TaxID=445787 RepID=A0A8C5MYH7_9ANUR
MRRQNLRFLFVKDLLEVAVPLRYFHRQRSLFLMPEDPPPKRPWPEELLMVPKIGTHKGTFHCHEALACYLLRIMEPYSNAEIIRTRDPQLLAQCDVVVYVGGKYDRLITAMSSRDTEAGFKKAMELTGIEFVSQLDFYHRSWLPARALVEEAIRTRFQGDDSGEVVILAQGGCPWKEHLFQLEQQLGLEKQIKYVLYPDQSWRILFVPMGPNTFQNRLSLPEDWRGLHSDDLSSVSGIPGCVFVHASGFIGGNETQGGALEMARKALTS